MNSVSIRIRKILLRLVILIFFLDLMVNRGWLIPHEIGHWLMARLFGNHPTEIVFWHNGHVLFGPEPMTAWQQAVVYVSGYLLELVLCLVSFLFYKEKRHWLKDLLYFSAAFLPIVLRSMNFFRTTLLLETNNALNSYHDGAAIILLTYEMPWVETACFGALLVVLTWIFAIAVKRKFFKNVWYAISAKPEDKVNAANENDETEDLPENKAESNDDAITGKDRVVKVLKIIGGVLLCYVIVLLGQLLWNFVHGCGHLLMTKILDIRVTKFSVWPRSTVSWGTRVLPAGKTILLYSMGIIFEWVFGFVLLTCYPKKQNWVKDIVFFSLLIQPLIVDTVVNLYNGVGMVKVLDGNTYTDGAKVFGWLQDTPWMIGAYSLTHLVILALFIFIGIKKQLFKNFWNSITFKI